MQNNRDFKGIWIPKEIWLDQNLTMQEKVFLAEIDSLDGADGCYASNDYFAKFFDLSKDRCKDIISSLVAKGKVVLELTHKGKNSDRRVIRGVGAKTPIPLGRKRPEGKGENALHITKQITKLRKDSSARKRTGKSIPHVIQSKKVKQTKTDGKIINDLIDLFADVNPMHERLFAITTERSALDDLVVKYGGDKVARMIKVLSVSNAAEFAPTITKPTELVRNLGRLKSWYLREQVKSRKSAVMSSDRKELIL